MTRLALSLVIGVAVLAVGALRYLEELKTSGLPQRWGTEVVEALDDTVRIGFDQQGVPFVEAASTRDLAVGLGYLHANDRLFQMELGRRMGQGRLAEILGSDLVSLDLRQKTLGLADVAERSHALSSERAREWYSGYAEGVNAWIDGRGDDLPPEFRLLGFQPEHWSPSDSALFALLMADDLIHPGEYEVTNAAWVGMVGSSGLAEVLGVDDVHLPADLEGWIQRAEAKGETSDPGAERRGYSNNWAVGAERARRGSALLAGDPHLSLRLPAQFFMVRLRAPGFDAFGATLPGHPAVAIGRSATRAWSLTNTGLDVDDLTLEKYDAERDAVERAGGWLAVERETVTIEVRGSDPVTATVARTDRGPLLPAVPDASDVTAYPRSLTWTALEPGDSLELFLSLVEDPSRDAVREAAAGFVAPAQNLVCAELDGTTWFTVIGRAPDRIAGDGRLPVLGSAEGYGWRGLHPQSANPFVESSADGALWTANNDIRPEGYALSFESQWAPDDRAEGIERRLSERDDWSVEDFLALQLDLHSLLAERVVGALDVDDTGGDPEAIEVLEHLQGWDRRMTGSGGALFVLLMRRLEGAIFDEKLDSERLSGPDGRRLDDAVARLLAGQISSAWFDAPGTDVIEGRSDVLPRALASTLALGEELFGTRDIEQWRLDQIQTLELAHPLSSAPLIGPDLKRGPIGLDGHGSTIAALWTRWNGRGFRVTGGASLRWATNVEDSVLTYHVQPGGQSGHPYDVHFDDQLEHWRAGRWLPAPSTTPTLHPSSILWLVPANRARTRGPLNLSH